MSRKPAWIRVKAPGSALWRETSALLEGRGLSTVCQEAACPNIGECWEQKHATFMIMGEVCTRACAFCNVATGLPAPLDPSEPERVALATRDLGLAHVVVTSVDRDDLPDGGAAHFARTVEAIRAHCAGDDDRNPDAGLSAKARRAGDGRRVAPGRVQPQSRNRARPLPRRAARRALFPFAAAVAAGQGTRSRDLHQIRADGRAWREAERGRPGDGRSAHGRCGFPHARPIFAADAQASRGRRIRDSRGLQGL